jgi:hypothetical protein
MQFLSPVLILSAVLLQMLAAMKAQGRLLLFTQPNCQGEAVHLPCAVSFGGEHKCVSGYFKSYHVPHLSRDENDPKHLQPRLHAMVRRQVTSRSD